jgi:hypothetical protein
VNTALRLLATIVLLAAGARGSAATLERDLGQGLSLFRVHVLPDDLPTPAGRPGACVLDLRYAKASDTSPSALRAWIKFNASSRTPIFVVENAQTSPSILACVPMGVSGLIILAPESDRLGADFQVRVTQDGDRRAYDALEKGAPVESLLHDFPGKPRVDEAYLDKEHISDGDAPEVPADAPVVSPPLVDALLQRAVQLHRGLIALKKV